MIQTHDDYLLRSYPNGQRKGSNSEQATKAVVLMIKELFVCYYLHATILQTKICWSMKTLLNNHSSLFNKVSCRRCNLEQDGQAILTETQIT
jgi:hypothetical protein